MIKDCRYQLRVGFGGAYALDFGAIMQVATARGAASALLSEVLPDIEAILISHMRAAQGDGEGADSGG